MFRKHVKATKARVEKEERKLGKLKPETSP